MKNIVSLSNNNKSQLCFMFGGIISGVYINIYSLPHENRSPLGEIP